MSVGPGSVGGALGRVGLGPGLVGPGSVGAGSWVGRGGVLGR